MNRFLIAICFTVLAFVYLQVDLVEAEAEEPSCKKVMADLTKKQLGGISACGKSMKFKNSKEKSKKMNCILRCVMMTEKVLDEKGYFTAAAVDDLMIRMFPPYLVEKANATFSKCIPTADSIDPNPETDEFCKSYDPFIKCMLGSIPTLCS